MLFRSNDTATTEIYTSLHTLSLHDALPISVLCVMGGRLWFLGHAYSSYTCTGSALDVMDYGLAKAKEFSNELTAQTLLIVRIIALGLILQ